MDTSWCVLCAYGGATAALATHPDAHVLATLVQPHNLLGRRGAGVHNYLLAVQRARNRYDLLPRESALKRDQLLWRLTLLRTRVAVHSDSDTVGVPSPLHRM